MRGPARPVQRNLSEPPDAQLQPAVVISKVDPGAVFAKTIWPHFDALNQAVVANQNPDIDFGFEDFTQKDAKISLEQE